MLEVENLTASIGATEIIREASLSVADGSMCGLIGVNGAGKTTLLRALMGAIAARGKASFDGLDLIATPAHRRAALGIGYMPEDRRLVPEFTVEQNIMMPTWSVAAPDDAARLEWIYGLLPEIARFESRRSFELSGGQQKLVALGRALMAGRKLLMLDEPFEGIAPVLAQRLAQVLLDLRREHVSVLIAESNRIHVEGLLDAVYVIERGAVRPG
jgi:branched-chain amino acid transport system ATP-binding protein